MFDEVLFIKTICETYFPNYQFAHGNAKTVNVDLSNVSNRLIILDRPVSAKSRITESSVFETTYTARMLFLIPNKYMNEGGDEINEYQDAIDTNMIIPAKAMAYDFLRALQNDTNVSGNVQFGYDDITDSPLLNNNASGILLYLSFTIANAGNLCKAPNLPEEEGD